jgi:hypothetical protein
VDCRERRLWKTLAGRILRRWQEGGHYRKFVHVEQEGKKGDSKGEIGGDRQVVLHLAG